MKFARKATTAGGGAPPPFPCPIQTQGGGGQPLAGLPLFCALRPLSMALSTRKNALHRHTGIE